MIINNTFYIVTHDDAHGLDIGYIYGWAQGVINELKSIDSQKWNLVPYFKNGTVFFLLVNEANNILAHDNENSNTVAYGYDPEKITYMHCWRIQQNNDHTFFKAVDKNFKIINYVLTANGNKIGDNVKIGPYNEQDDDQKWELIDFV